jgi:hypothetical protein
MTQPQLSPGTPLAGGGVGGTWLYTWTEPPQIAWQGWVATGTTWTVPPEFEDVQLQAYYPPEPPADAPAPPEGGGTWTVIRVVPPGGWLSELSEMW